MTLLALEQKGGTDLVDSHNKRNIDRINAIVTQVNLLPEDVGHIAQACLVIITKPTAADTVTIEGDVYEFGGSGSNINVTIGADAAAARANLIAAINAEGSELVVADAPTTPATAVRIRPADRTGGTAQIGAGTDIAVSTTLAAGDPDVWNVANLDESGAPAYKKTASGKIVITAESLANTFTLELPFTPAVLQWAAFDTNEAPKATDCQCKINGDYLEFDFNAGSTDLSATDIVVWQAYGN